MSVGKRSELWDHFHPCYLDRSGKYYRCVHCGEIVHSSERWNHLRYEHPEIWEKVRMARRMRDEGKGIQKVVAFT